MKSFAILLIILLTACSGGGDLSKKGDSSRPISNTIGSTAPAKESAPWQSALAGMIGAPFEQRHEGDQLVLLIKNASPFDETAFENLVLTVAKKFHGLSSPIRQIRIEALAAGQSLLTAEIGLADVALHLQGKISQPELLRRFQVETVETVDSLKIKVRKARQEGANGDVLGFLGKWMKLESDSLLALSLMGNVYRDEKKYAEAIPFYKKILTFDSRSVFAWRNIGYCYDRMGAYDSARKAYLGALEIEPQNFLLIHQLASVMGKNGEGAKALEWLANAHKIRETVDGWMIEGNILRDMKKYEQAKTAYFKAQKINPADFRILFNLLLVDLDMKKYAEAKKKYAELKMKEPLLAAELKGVEIFEDL